MAKLFGFSIEDSEEESKSVVSPVPPAQEDGNDHYVTSGFFGSYVDIEGTFKTEIDLIRRYREMALHPEVDSAIEDIVNEAVVSDLNDSPVEIELSNLNASDGIKKTIRQEFKNIKDLLDFDKKSHEIYRNWYIDGRLYYHKVIDLKAPNEGIKELRYIDAAKMKFVRHAKQQNKELGVRKQELSSLDMAFPELEEYFVYTPKLNQPMSNMGASSDQKGVKFSKDSITYCTSGLVDRNKGSTLSYLHKSIKALNQLRMIEDSLVIYRLSRAPERRIFYIDVGNLPKVKAEQYLRDVMSRYRNKLVYNANTGEIRDDKKMMSMMEDFWLPRREGGRGTEITTLPGGQNLGEITDIEYFKKKLYKALNVPISRIEGDGGFNLGRSSEILRDELKFSKFVGRLRKRFSAMFLDMLKTQLLLKNVVTPEDWEVMSEHIQFDFLYDNHFSELKEAELMENRINLATLAEPYIGKYYSQDYVRRKIIRQTDADILEEDAKIDQEIKDGIIVDPLEAAMAVDGFEPGQQQPQEGAVSSSPALGATPKEPDLEKQGKKTEAPEGGEI
tara:strand:- start:118 stop:1794 length:1677 start_codon:yes stop_codon:yes gene_type:complete